MICQRCLQRIGQRAAARSSSAVRHFSRTTSPRAQAVTADTTTTSPRPDGHPAATSTSAAQPFSSSLTPVSNSQDFPPAQQPPAVVSSVKAGTVLKGLNFMKNQQDPVALEDSEYPAWLWRVLDKKGDAAAGEAGVEGDAFSKSKKQRRLAAKALRKQQLLNPDALGPKIPVYEQTIDLPGGDGSLSAAKEAGGARADLTKAMRDKRRAKIKEDNFLKEMR